MRLWDWIWRRGEIGKDLQLSKDLQGKACFPGWRSLVFLKFLMNSLPYFLSVGLVWFYSLFLFFIGRSYYLDSASLKLMPLFLLDPFWLGYNCTTTTSTDFYVLHKKSQASFLKAWHILHICVVYSFFHDLVQKPLPKVVYF